MLQLKHSLKPKRKIRKIKEMRKIIIMCREIYLNNNYAQCNKLPGIKKLRLRKLSITVTN